MYRPSRTRRASLAIALAIAVAASGWIGWVLLSETAPDAIGPPSAIPSVTDAEVARPVGGAPAGSSPSAPLQSVEREKTVGADGVLVRVIDATGKPVQGIPVALMDHQKWPRHPIDLLRECTYLRSFHGRGPSLLSPEDRTMMDPAELLARPRGGQTSRAELVALIEKPVWLLDGERPVLELEREFLARAVSDSGGEASLPWDRNRHPLVQICFAFPSRPAAGSSLDASEAGEPARAVLTLPSLEGVSIRRAEEEAVRWKARVTVACTLQDGSALWAAWSAPASSSDASAESSWFWERGLDARIEAAIEAPLAPVVLQPLAKSSTEPRRVVLRAAEHYSSLRGTVLAADDGSLAGERVLLRRACRSEPEGPLRGDSGELHVDRAEIALDEQGSFLIWMAAQPCTLRQRTLCVRLASAGDADGTPKEQVVTYEGSSPEVRILSQHRSPALDDLETYVDLRVPDPAGTSRDLGTLRLGDGPHLVRGRVLWDDGTPVERGVVILPYGVTNETESNREGLQISEGGNFRRLGIPTGGAWELDVTANSIDTSKFSVDPGREDLELRVPRRGGLAGCVVLPAWSQIDVCVQSQSGIEQNARTQANGNFNITGVPLGRSDVVFRSGGLDLHVVPGVELTAMGTNRPDALKSVDLRPYVTYCVLELRDERGKKKVYAKVALEDTASGFKLEGSAGQDGRFPCMVPKRIERFVVKVPQHRSRVVDVIAEPIVLNLEAER